MSKLCGNCGSSGHGFNECIYYAGKILQKDFDILNEKAKKYDEMMEYMEKRMEELNK